MDGLRKGALQIVRKTSSLPALTNYQAIGLLIGFFLLPFAALWWLDVWGTGWFFRTVVVAVVIIFFLGGYDYRYRESAAEGLQTLILLLALIALTLL